MKLSFEMFVLSDNKVTATVNQQILEKLFACQESCFYKSSSGLIETASTTAESALIEKIEYRGVYDVEVLGVNKMQKEVAYALSQVSALQSSMGAMKMLKIVNDGTQTVSLASDTDVSSKTYLKYMHETKFAADVTTSTHTANTAEECRASCVSDSKCAAWEFNYNTQCDSNALCAKGSVATDANTLARKFTVEHNPKMCYNRKSATGLQAMTSTPSTACRTVQMKDMKDEKAFLKNRIQIKQLRVWFCERR
jgi:hypothetical protein